MAKFILDTRLSDDHYVVCREAIRRNVIGPTDLNEGRRLLSEQAKFWSDWLRFRRVIAAFPSPGAPHIKWGRNNHAIDCNDGASDRLAAFYRSLGVPAVFNVVGEPWHIDFPDGAALKRAADRIRKDRATLRRGKRGKAVKYLKYRLHYVHDPDTRKPYFAPRRPEKGYGPWFDVDLESAVKRFQRDRGLKADGVVGDRTKRAVKAAYKAAQKRRRSK